MLKGLQIGSLNVIILFLLRKTYLHPRLFVSKCDITKGLEYAWGGLVTIQ